MRKKEFKVLSETTGSYEKQNKIAKTRLQLEGYNPTKSKCPSLNHF